ncbi:androgen induced inhibitor of proliferation (as3) / pds5, partial [Clonorchis sinensis]
MKSVGYSIIYPPGCKELSESLRITDLRKRLNDLSAAFDKLSETDDLCDSDGETTHHVDSSTQPGKFDYLKGLLLLLTSPAYSEHHDRDIQLRVGICVCKMLKIF